MATIETLSGPDCLSWRSIAVRGGGGAHTPTGGFYLFPSVLYYTTLMNHASSPQRFVSPFPSTTTRALTLLFSRRRRFRLKPLRMAVRSSARVWRNSREVGFEIKKYFYSAPISISLPLATLTF